MVVFDIAVGLRVIRRGEDVAGSPGLQVIAEGLRDQRRACDQSITLTTILNFDNELHVFWSPMIKHIFKIDNAVGGEDNADLFDDSHSMTPGSMYAWECHAG
jgi:hypothetical protein